VFQLASQDPGVKREKPGGPSADGARIEAPKAPRGVRCGKGVSRSPLEEGSGEGAVPSPQKIFRFLSSKNDLWCILGSIFAVEWKLVRPPSGMH